MVQYKYVRNVYLYIGSLPRSRFYCGLPVSLPTSIGGRLTKSECESKFQIKLFCCFIIIIDMVRYLIVLIVIKLFCLTASNSSTVFKTHTIPN